jgi:hypothetical protein
MIFAKRLVRHGHMRLFTIEHDVGAGWVAREQDDRVTHTRIIRKWGRVEAAVALFEQKASALRGDGWLDISASA